MLQVVCMWDVGGVDPGGRDGSRSPPQTHPPTHLHQLAAIGSREHDGAKLEEAQGARAVRVDGAEHALERAAHVPHTTRVGLELAAELVEADVAAAVAVDALQHRAERQHLRGGGWW